MKNFDKIIELLEKERLTEKESAELNQIVEADPESNEFFKTYQKLKSAFLLSKHLSENDFVEYVLFKNENISGIDKYFIKSAVFDSHLKKCRTCQDQLKLYVSEFAEVDSYISEQFKQKTLPENKFIKFSKDANVRKAFWGFAAIILITVILVTASNLTSPKFYTLAKLDENIDFSISRGRSTDYFQKSIKALEEKNYTEGIDQLKRDIYYYPNDETIFYSYYILGLTYLATAEKSFLGLFPTYDASSAKSAYESFMNSISHNNSGKFQNVLLDSYFYAAKSLLMLNNQTEAKKYFEVVVNEKGSKMKEAAAILNELK